MEKKSKFMYTNNAYAGDGKPKHQKKTALRSSLSNLSNSGYHDIFLGQGSRFTTT